MQLVEHGDTHHVNLALLTVQVSNPLGMMADVLLQSFGIDFIPRVSTFAVNKLNFVTVCFHDAPDVYQLVLLLIQAHPLS